MINLNIISRDWRLFSQLYEQSDALKRQYNLIYAGETPNKDILLQSTVLLGEPSLLSQYIEHCPNLVWVQSTWAGNNKLQAHHKQDYVLTGVKDVFGEQMVEYVLSYLLYFSRRLEDFNSLKTARKWEQLVCQPLSNYHVGIMGMGSIGMQLANKLLSMGMQVNALSRTSSMLSQQSLPDKVSIFKACELQGFLQASNVVISVLPETDVTKGFCNAAFFETMQAQSIFMNVGRGSLLDRPESLIKSLNNGHLKAAVLDVYDVEPLPSEHPFYDTDNLFISCHTAAISEPDKVFELFVNNAQKFINKQTLLYEHDFKKGY